MRLWWTGKPSRVLRVGLAGANGPCRPDEGARPADRDSDRRAFFLGGLASWNRVSRYHKLYTYIIIRSPKNCMDIHRTTMRKGPKTPTIVASPILTPSEPLNPKPRALNA